MAPLRPQTPEKGDLGSASFATFSLPTAANAANQPEGSIGTVSDQCRGPRVALLRSVPASLAEALLAPGINKDEINIDVARSQHAAYVALLREHCAVVHELPAADALPDSVFVEDATVVLRNRAIQGIAGHTSRAAEAALLTPALADVGIDVLSSSVRLDGGDILRAGDMFFVGISTRTEAAAVRALEERFSCKAFPIDVTGGTLHLKSLVTWVQKAQCLIAEDTPAGRTAVRQMIERSHKLWNVLWTPAEAPGAANVLDLGDVVLIQQMHWDAVEDLRAGLEKAGVRPLPCDMSELVKLNGALTCCSVLSWN